MCGFISSSLYSFSFYSDFFFKTLSLAHSLVLYIFSLSLSLSLSFSLSLSLSLLHTDTQTHARTHTHTHTHIYIYIYIYILHRLLFMISLTHSLLTVYFPFPPFPVTPLLPPLRVDIGFRLLERLITHAYPPFLSAILADQLILYSQSHYIVKLKVKVKIQ